MYIVGVIEKATEASKPYWSYTEYANKFSNPHYKEVIAKASCDGSPQATTPQIVENQSSQPNIVTQEQRVTSQTTFHFADFPISTVYRGEVQFPDFRGRDRDFSTFRTRIKDAMRDGANFAGKYRIVTIGCGTGCRFYYVADVSSGHVIGFPLAGEDYGHLDLFYKLDSSLVIAVWDDAPATCSGKDAPGAARLPARI
jgi:hypothetical protein